MNDDFLDKPYFFEEGGYKWLQKMYHPKKCSTNSNIFLIYNTDLPTLSLKAKKAHYFYLNKKKQLCLLSIPCEESFPSIEIENVPEQIPSLTYVQRTLLNKIKRIIQKRNELLSLLNEDLEPNEDEIIIEITVDDKIDLTELHNTIQLIHWDRDKKNEYDEKTKLKTPYNTAVDCYNTVRFSFCDEATLLNSLLNDFETIIDKYKENYIEQLASYAENSLHSCESDLVYVLTIIKEKYLLKLDNAESIFFSAILEDDLIFSECNREEKELLYTSHKKFVTRFSKKLQQTKNEINNIHRTTVVTKLNNKYKYPEAEEEKPIINKNKSKRNKPRFAIIKTSSKKESYICTYKKKKPQHHAAALSVKTQQVKINTYKSYKKHSRCIEYHSKRRSDFVNSNTAGISHFITANAFNKRLITSFSNPGDILAALKKHLAAESIVHFNFNDYDNQRTLKKIDNNQPAIIFAESIQSIGNKTFYYFTSGEITPKQWIILKARAVQKTNNAHIAIRIFFIDNGTIYYQDNKSFPKPLFLSIRPIPNICMSCKMAPCGMDVNSFVLTLTHIIDKIFYSQSLKKHKPIKIVQPFSTSTVRKNSSDMLQKSHDHSYSFECKLYIISEIFIASGLLIIDIGIPCGINNTFNWRRDINPLNIDRFNNAMWMTIGYIFMLISAGILLSFWRIHKTNLAIEENEFSIQNNLAFVSPLN